MKEKSTDWIIQDYRFPSPELLFGKSIILYGAGKVGRDFYCQLVRYEKVKILAWVDKKYSDCPYPYYSVKPVETILNFTCDYILLAVLKESLRDSIISELTKKGLPKDKIIWIKPDRRVKDINYSPINCNIVKIIGGLGNQMFQYAFYLALKNKGFKTKVNIDEFKGYRWNFELTKVFSNANIDFDSLNDFAAYNQGNKHCLVQEKEDSVYDSTVFSYQDASFVGYWQTEKYFSDIKEQVKKAFHFNIKNKTLQTFAEKLLNIDNTVSIHVRRGDYLKASEIYGGICTIKYYRNAMEFIEQKIMNPQYVIFSDDLNWVKNNLKIDQAIYVSSVMFDYYESWYDMFLMTCCKNNIIANSSFSWWGAWLNENPNKIVVAPKIWLNGRKCTDIWCNGWIKV